MTAKNNTYYSIIFLLIINFVTNITVRANEVKEANPSTTKVIAQSSQFMSEHQLDAALSDEIEKFWQQGYFSHFNALDKTRINFAQFSDDENKVCLVIVSGRTETYLKYQELSYDLYKKGYNIFLLDHRGQGMSERLLTNPNKGYVTSFTDYENDLSYFIDNVVNKACQSKPYLLAHSMGGAISARYMQRFPNSIKAAVLSSPMIGFNSGPIPTFIAKPLITFSQTLNNLMSNEPWYFLGQNDYQAVPFNSNELTHSKIRYQSFVDLYQSTTQVQLGGVTINWLYESIKAQNKIFSQLKQLKTPILVLQASEDTVVDNQAQNDFCQQLHQLQPQSCPNAKPVVIKGAYHELFIESDAMREQAIKTLLSWFEHH